MTATRDKGRVVALCGGVGGAKLAVGLQAVLGDNLTVVVNVADDFRHLGLHISPDLDTVLYTLAGLNDSGRGWGRAGESWNFMAALAEFGGETWFALGDRDLALHVERTRRLERGETLTDVTRDVAGRLGIAAQIVPVSDDSVQTIVETDEGPLPFQRYFVERRCQPVVRQIHFAGADRAKMTPQVAAALSDDGLRAIVVCPSNPYLSVDPILAVPGIRAALEHAAAPVVAVSPIIAGQAVKGPTRKIMDELGIAATTMSIANHYRGLIDGLVVDAADAVDSDALGIGLHAAPTLMTDMASKTNLAREVLSFSDGLADHGRCLR